MDVLSCVSCGAPLSTLPGQFIHDCRYCGGRNYLPSEWPPVTVLRPGIDLAAAKRIVLAQLRDREVAPAFRRGSFFERATLFFLPFFEVNGIRAGKILRPPLPPPARESENESQTLGISFSCNDGPAGVDQTGSVVYSYTAYSYLEPAGQAVDLDLGFIDTDRVEAMLPQAETMPFDPVALRRLGVLLPVRGLPTVPHNLGPTCLPVLEQHVRIVYVPVWEIVYTYSGLVFKSYVTAVDGVCLQWSALRHPQRKAALSLLGLFGIGVLAGRLSKMIPMVLVFGLSLMAMLVLFVGAALLLLPFLWQNVAAPEIVTCNGPFRRYEPLEGTERGISGWFNRVRDRFLASEIRHDDERD